MNKPAKAVALTLGSIAFCSIIAAVIRETKEHVKRNKKARVRR